jgi:hypothetical protein
MKDIYVKKERQFLIGVVSSAERQWRGIPIWKLVVSLVDRDIQHGSFQSEFLPQEVLGYVYQPNATVHSQICEWEQVQLLPSWFTISRKLPSVMLLWCCQGLACVVSPWILLFRYSNAWQELWGYCNVFSSCKCYWSSTGMGARSVSTGHLFHQEVKFFFLWKNGKRVAEIA